MRTSFTPSGAVMLAERSICSSSSSLEIMVRYASGMTGHLAVLHVLEEIFPVRFILLPTALTEEICFEFISENPSEPQRYFSIAAPVEGDEATEGVFVKFLDDKEVPFPFRGRGVRIKGPILYRAFKAQPDEKVLALIDGRPVWASQQTQQSIRSAFTLPAFPPGSNLHSILNPERFIELLPLLDWLRHVCGENLYDGPTMRACFVFDDPNLHWSSYGFVNYREIVKHAERENYHVSFATIPLDAWFAHKPTTELFRASGKRLSLAIHGNNHVKQELCRSYSPETRSALLGQAIARIQRLERKTGLEVSRVMIPPHGACTEQMFADLPANGFEAACNSHGSMQANNQGREWIRTLGYQPSEIVESCPVLPRWSISGDVTNRILLAGFLKQAIILRGHHDDLRDGIEILDEQARIINGLGNVQWSSLRDLSRGNYETKAVGNTLHIRPLARKISVAVPGETCRMVVESPFGDSMVLEQKCGKEVRPIGPQMFPVGERDLQVFIKPRNGGPIPTDGIRHPTVCGLTLPKIWPLVRRILSEGRDRLAPYRPT
jgi:hypothetical protein